MLSMPRRFSRAVLAGAIAGALLHAGAAQAQVSDDVIRIGFITDMSGVYSGPDGLAGPKPSRWPSRRWAARSTARRSNC